MHQLAQSAPTAAVSAAGADGRRLPCLGEEHPGGRRRRLSRPVHLLIIRHARGDGEHALEQRGGDEGVPEGAELHARGGEQQHKHKYT